MDQPTEQPTAASAPDDPAGSTRDFRIDPDTALAVKDSHQLLAFLARTPIEFETKQDQDNFNNHMRAIAKLQCAVANGKAISATDHGDFWTAFIALSRLGAPATIESMTYYFQYYHPRGFLGFGKGSGGRAAHTFFTTTLLLTTLLLSLLGFVGSRTLDQFAADGRHWYNLVHLARLTSYGEPLHATFDRDGRTLLIGTVERESGAAPRLPTLPPGGATVALVPGPDGVSRPAPFTQVAQIPPDRVVRLRAALPGLLDTTRPMDTRVWHPACRTAEPCMPRQHVLLAEEFVYTLAALHTERRILETLLLPVQVLEEQLYPGGGGSVPQAASVPNACNIQSPFEEAQAALRASVEAGGNGSDAGVDGGASGAARDATRRERLNQLMEDPVRLNRIFLFVLCNNLPMPINLPPPLHGMLTMGFKADLTLNVLNTYILTLLFGALGACVHVMRDTNRRLENFTLTRGMVNRYWARVILGAVSGAFIGFFFNASGELGLVTGPGNPASSLTSNLTGVALAFLAGFSVEVLFAILDRLTQIFRDFAYGPENMPSRVAGLGAEVRRVRMP
jgi:uncharacterized membrane protein